MKPYRWLEIAGNLLFWALTTWVVIQLFSVQTYEMESINGVETIKATRDPVFDRLLWMGQMLKALFFYINLRQVISLSDSPRPWVKAIGVSGLWLAGLLLTEWFLGRQFLLRAPLPFPWGLMSGIYLFYLAVSTAYGMMKVWFRQEAVRKALELGKKQVELQLLRAQLHPHFLFNTLNNLLSMVDQERNPQLAEGFERLSGLLRYVVYETGQASVPLRREVQFLRDYADLARLRYDDREVDFRLEQRGAFDGQPIEPGLLAALLENAFKHGVQPETASFIHLLIDVTAPGELIVTIANSRHLKADPGRNAAGMGLRATRDRLQLVYPGRHTLEIREEEHRYTVTLKIQTT